MKIMHWLLRMKLKQQQFQLKLMQGPDHMKIMHWLLRMKLKQQQFHVRRGMARSLWHWSGGENWSIQWSHGARAVCRLEQAVAETSAWRVRLSLIAVEKRCRVG